MAGSLKKLKLFCSGVQVVAEALGRQGRADEVVVVGRDLPVGEEVGPRAAHRVARSADHRVPQRVGDVDLRLPRGRVDHRAQAAGVRPERRQPGVVQVRADLGDRGLAPELGQVLAVLEELEAAVAHGREVVEDLDEPAGQRHERPEVRRVVGEVRAAEVAHRRRDACGGAARDAATRDRVADREVLHAELAGRHEPLADRAARAAERPRRP